MALYEYFFLYILCVAACHFFVFPDGLMVLTSARLSDPLPLCCLDLKDAAGLTPSFKTFIFVLQLKEQSHMHNKRQYGVLEDVQ